MGDRDTRARPQARGLLGRLARLLRARAQPPAPALPPLGAALIEGMGWHRFELLAAEGFRQRGYMVSETGGAGTRSVDMVLQRGAERFLVDCKPWRAQAVGAAPLRELHALILARGAAGGFVITSGEFTDEARRFSARRNIELIEGRALAELLSTRQEKTQPLVRRDARFLDSTLPPSAWKARHQPCPLCGAGMVERVVPPGRRVLGCSHFPLCEGTREL